MCFSAAHIWECTFCLWLHLHILMVNTVFDNFQGHYFRGGMYILANTQHI